MVSMVTPFALVPSPQGAGWLRSAPRAKVPKKLQYFSERARVTLFYDERITKIGRDRRSRPRDIRSAAAPRAPRAGHDARRPRRPRGPHAVGPVADRERQARAQADPGGAARHRARGARR